MLLTLFLFPSSTNYIYVCMCVIPQVSMCNTRSRYKLHPLKNNFHFHFPTAAADEKAFVVRHFEVRDRATAKTNIETLRANDFLLRF